MATPNGTPTDRSDPAGTWSDPDLDTLALLMDGEALFDPPAPTQSTAATAQASRVNEKASAVGRRRPTKRAPSYNSNHARAEQRKELAMLRARAEALESELVLLQSARCRASGEPSRSSLKARDPVDEQAKRAATVWREIATRQYEQCTAAVSERRQLMQRVAAQEKLISQLRHLAFCRASEKTIEQFVGYRDWYPAFDTIEPFDVAVFGHLSTELERCYAKMDQVFLQDNSPVVGIASSGAYRRTDTDGHLYFQVFGSKLFPFNVPTTGATAWKRFSRSIRPNDSSIFIQLFETPDDMVAECFATELSLECEKTVVLAQQLKRLYRDGERMAIVWHSHVEAVSFMDKPLAGAKFQERGYFLIERPPTAPDGFAVMRTCYMIEPDVPTQFVPQNSIALALTEFVFKWMAATIPANHQILEDMLVLNSTGLA